MGWTGAFVPKRLDFQGSFQGLMEGFNPHAKLQKPTKRCLPQAWLPPLH